MGRTDDDIATRTATDPASAATGVDEDETVVDDHAATGPIEPVMDVDEWLADEAGYGYGV